jgi:hypothetical protein
MDGQNPFVPVIYTSTSLLLVALPLRSRLSEAADFAADLAQAALAYSHLTR